MNVEQFCSASRIVVLAGKGGVGKTTVTAALATAAARAGASVLIVEVEGKSGLATALGVPPLTYEEQPVRERLRVRTLTPDEALREYLEDRGLQRISRRLMKSGALDVVATAVPGMKDILVLGKVKALEQAHDADLILLDAPAAGHAISFLLSPRGLLDAVRVGPVRAQAEDVIELLSDPTRCRVALVTLPEETPVNELVDTAFALEDRVGVKLAPVIVNAVPEALPIDGHRAAADAAAAGLGLPEREAVALDAAAAFRNERHALALDQAARLAHRLPLPQLHLPFVFGEIGPADIDVLADALTAGIAELPGPGP
ncbi:MAG TPA: ArsA-related P-loop ATPase [Acidimicrobiia bacterium]|nr:ArsA-related P-loop ATPase [Acidimicrobiia bacterium]